MNSFLVVLSCKAVKQFEITAKTYEIAENILNKDYEKYWNDFMQNANKTYDENTTIEPAGNNKYLITLSCNADYSFNIEAESYEELDNNPFEKEWNIFTEGSSKTYDEDVDIFRLN